MAVVTQGFPPLLGGSERYHFMAARALEERTEVRVFTSASVRSAVGDPPDPEWTLPRGSVDRLASFNLLGEKLANPARLWRALSDFDPDLVWGNHPSPTADVGALFALAHRRPWIATYHADVRGRRWIDRRYQAWEDRFLPRARHLLVTTDFYARALAQRGVPPDRITSVPTGPYLRRFDAAPTAGNAGPDRPFLFVGVLDPPHAYKGLDRLLEAVSVLAGTGLRVNLEVVGDGPDRASYERWVEARGLADRVRFLGRIGDAELAQRFAAAWALVLPAGGPTEGFGTAAVDGFYCGCPVVLAADLPAAELFVRLGAGYAIPGGSVTELAEGLQTVWNDARLRARLAAATPGAREALRWDRLLPQMLGPVYAALNLSVEPPGRGAA